MKKITIIIPTYNEAENLPKMVSALFSLPLPELDLLVVDDNSPDGTGQMAEDLGKQNGASADAANRCSITCQNPRVCGDGVADTDLDEQCDLGAKNGRLLDAQLDPVDTGGMVYCDAD